MQTTFRACLFSFVSALVLSTALTSAATAQNARSVSFPPTPEDWAALGKLPDLSGIWLPDLQDQRDQEDGNPPPWTPKAKAMMDAMIARENDGGSHGIFVNCLPQGMPSFMAITHNAIEFLVTPGRITMTGELDGNSVRRIYTDGRPHPEDPDPSFSGHSIGRWENGQLIVDTVAIHPEVLIATTETAGVPNNGGMHIVERWEFANPNLLLNHMEITAPKVLTGTWKTTRKYFRNPGDNSEFVSGVCIEGNFEPTVDKDGNHIFVPRKYTFTR
jgi:hypothetical protein